MDNEQWTYIVERKTKDTQAQCKSDQEQFHTRGVDDIILGTSWVRGVDDMRLLLIIERSRVLFLCLERSNVFRRVCSLVE